MVIRENRFDFEGSACSEVGKVQEDVHVRMAEVREGRLVSGWIGGILFGTLRGCRVHCWGVSLVSVYACPLAG